MLWLARKDVRFWSKDQTGLSGRSGRAEKKGFSMPLLISAVLLLAALQILLTLRTIRQRRANKVSLGDGGVESLQRAIRAHANFAETVPLGLALALLLALQGWAYAGGGVALLLFAGRACHAWGVSRSPEDFRFRVTGMAVTFTSYIAAAALLIGSLLS
jgi:uncharacterized membrane protein YecN with MAPEG domain